MIRFTNMETTTQKAMATDVPRVQELPGELKYIKYEHKLEAEYLPAIREMISKDLSEPYSIYVYRYFLYQWGHLCFMVRGRSWTVWDSSMSEDGPR